MTFNDSRVSLQNDDVIGPQIDITMPQIVEIKYNGHTLWVNVDEVCRLRITKIKEGAGVILNTYTRIYTKRDNGRTEND